MTTLLIAAAKANLLDCIMADITNPHDKFFKEQFSQIELTQDFLRHYLPEAVLAHLDLERIEPEKESFIDENLKEYFSDLLFRIPYQQGEGQTYLFLLFEHKSYWSRWVWLQLLSYMVRFWEREVAAGAKSLSPIIPLLIYHGKEPWKGRCTLDDVYDGPAALRSYLPDFTYKLYDFSHLSEEEIRGRAHLQLILHILRHIFDPQLPTLLPGIFDLFRQLENQEKALQSMATVLRYLTATADRLSETTLREALAPVLRQEGDDLMSTIAQQWLKEGLQQGRNEGLSQGVQAMQQNVLELLELRFPLMGRGFRGRVAAITDLDHLRLLIRQAALAPTIEEFTQTLASLE